MADWLVQDDARDVLDPAIGTGVLTRAILARLPSANITAFDLDPHIINHSRLSGHPHVRIFERDFLAAQEIGAFDAVTMNPPYIRHREIEGQEKARVELSVQSGYIIPKSANLYIYFAIKALSHLKADGRAAFLLPAEWMNSNFGANFKRMLLEQNYLEEIVTFSGCSNIFDDALTTASVLLLRKKERKRARAWYIRGVDFSTAPSSHHQLAQTVESLDIPYANLQRVSKWEQILEGRKSDVLKGWTRLGELAQTRRGIATGCNSFFLVSQATLDQAGIRQTSAIPCIGRAADVPVFNFQQSDFEALSSSGKRIWLVDLPKKLTTAESEYIARGAEEGFDKRYLCAARTPWYRMEKRDVAPIWASVFGRQGLRFIMNSAGVKTLTTFHGVYPHDQRNVFAKALAFCLNMPCVRKESELHMRRYGGGLIKFEPNDLQAIPVPDLRKVSLFTLTKLADLLTELDETARASFLDKRSDDWNEIVLAAGKEAAANAGSLSLE